MSFIANVVIAVLAVIHFYFLILEMFLWDKPLGLKTFNQTPEAAKISKVLAANQGMYNGFLSAGLVWGLLLGTNGTEIKSFFLCFIIIAGVYGGITATRKAFVFQAAPAVIALAFMLMS